MKIRYGRAFWLVAAAIALVFRAFPAPADNSRRARIYVTSAASSLVNEGLAEAAPTGSEAAAYQPVPNPGIRFQPNEAQATTAPWIDTNAWRFQRGIQKANYVKLPAGSAPLAAAEAFTFNVDAILNPEAADLPELGKLLRFLKTQDQPPLPAMANIGIVDDHSPLMDEVLNMLTRRNLLYRVVPAPDRHLDVTVQLGTKDFPKESAENPSDFAARVRAKLGDDNRLVRLYGASTIIAHLTGDGKHARLYLLSYGRARGGGGGAGQGGGGGGQGLRIRVLGRYQPSKFAAYGAAADAKLTDVENPGNTTEFSLPAFAICATIDLDAVK
jgi:hypothetical protein